MTTAQEEKFDVTKLTDSEIKWGIFGQCFQSDTTRLNELCKERDRRLDQLKRGEE